MNDSVIKQSSKEKAEKIRILFNMSKIPFEKYKHLLARSRKKLGIKKEVNNER